MVVLHRQSWEPSQLLQLLQAALKPVFWSRGSDLARSWLGLLKLSASHARQAKQVHRPSKHDGHHTTSLCWPLASWLEVVLGVVTGLGQEVVSLLVERLVETRLGQLLTVSWICPRWYYIVTFLINCFGHLVWQSWLRHGLGQLSEK